MARAPGNTNRTRRPRLIGAMVFLAVAGALLALALGWRPLSSPSPVTAEVDRETMEEAMRDEAQMRELVEQGKASIGGP